MIRAGTPEEATERDANWAFVDPGFSNSSKSCGLLIGDGDPEDLRFADLKAELVRLAGYGNAPLNLAIEAPLSVSFDVLGNPTGRSVEKRGDRLRLWYVGLGCSVLVSATYLVRTITACAPKREIRLFEALVSFKGRGVRSSHKQDVVNIRRVVRGELDAGKVVAPEDLRLAEKDQLESAFRVAGMDYGVPPVIVVGA